MWFSRCGKTWTKFYIVAGLLAGLLLVGLAAGQVRPPNLSPDNLPDTAFTCEDKVCLALYGAFLT